MKWVLSQLAPRCTHVASYYVGYEGVGEEEPLVAVEEVPFSESDVDWFVIGVSVPSSAWRRV